MNQPSFAPVFPASNEALEEPNGLIAVGGELTVDWLLAAYRRGIFPWFSPGESILWWTPNPRMVLFPQEFHCSKSLRKVLKKNCYHIAMNTCFDKVMRACAAPRPNAEGTWISEDMVLAYSELHRQGYAHSFECYQNETLVGGLYGVKLGDIFFGESMFSLQADTSKVAFASLVAMARGDGIKLIDCQIAHPHLASLGAREISRDQFEDLLLLSSHDKIGSKSESGRQKTQREHLLGVWRGSLPLTTEALL